MVTFIDFLRDEPTDWLLEDDNASVRYLTLRHIVEMPEGHDQVQKAKRAIMVSDPVKTILDAQHEEGYWVKQGAGYVPKYRGTVWQVMFLGQLAADGNDPRVAKGCEYLLNNARTRGGAFSASQARAPSAAIDCLNGNLIHAYWQLGRGSDERVWQAVYRLCESVLRRGFECYGSGSLPCAWGAVKCLLALTSIPSGERSDDVKATIDESVDFLLSRDLAIADYACDTKVSANWFKFGFPLSYNSNVLEALQVIAEAGHGANKRLTNAIRLVLSKQDALGRWPLEFSLNGRMWVDIEQKGEPSKWVTLQALQTLKRIFGG